MIRPCFIVVDPEHSASISTRKLVIESAKLNVITAYSGAEAIETVEKYPAADGVVCNSELRDMLVSELVSAVKTINRKMPVVVVGASSSTGTNADYHVASFDPRRLVDTLQSIMPEKVSAIQEHEEELREDEIG